MAKNVVLSLIVSAFLVPAVARAAKEDPLEKKLKDVNISKPLEEVLKTLGEESGLTIRVDWDAVAGTGVKPEDKVTLKGGSYTIEQMLSLTLAQVGHPRKPLGWFISGNTVYVSTQMRVLRRRTGGEAATASDGKTTPGKVRPAAAGKLAVDGVPMEDVIQFIRDISDINIHVNWTSLKLVGIDKKTPITIKARNITIARALDMLTDQISADADVLSRVYWIIDDGVVEIATGTVLSKKMETRTYDIRDLLTVVPNFKGPRIDLTTSTSLSTDDDDDDDEDNWFEDDDDDDDDDRSEEEGSMAEQREKIKGNLVAIIKQTIGKEFWEPIGKGSVRVFRGKLIITQSLLGFKLMEESIR